MCHKRAAVRPAPTEGAACGPVGAQKGRFRLDAPQKGSLSALLEHKWVASGLVGAQMGRFRPCWSTKRATFGATSVSRCDFCRDPAFFTPRDVKCPERDGSTPARSRARTRERWFAPARTALKPNSNRARTRERPFAPARTELEPEIPAGCRLWRLAPAMLPSAGYAAGRRLPGRNRIPKPATAPAPRAPARPGVPPAHPEGPTPTARPASSRPR
jgi:hypothetical protein